MGTSYLVRVNRPRSALAKRASLPFTLISRRMAAYSVAWGVLPPGLVQYPLADMRSIIALVLSGSLASPSTLAAASRALIFLSPVGVFFAAGFLASVCLPLAFGAFWAGVLPVVFAAAFFFGAAFVVALVAVFFGVFFLVLVAIVRISKGSRKEISRPTWPAGQASSSSSGSGPSSSSSSSIVSCSVHMLPPR